MKENKDLQGRLEKALGVKVGNLIEKERENQFKRTITQKENEIE